jgi:hypothetical protein
VFYHLNNALNPFCFSYFSAKISHFLPGLASVCDPSTCVSQVAGMTGVTIVFITFILFQDDLMKTSRKLGE